MMRYEIQERVRRSLFSIVNREADYFLDESESFPRVFYHGGIAALPPLELPGLHNRHNLLAAIAVVRALDIGWQEIHKAIPKLVLPDLRLEHIHKNGVLFINDSYNASEASIKASLQSLPVPKAGNKKIAVIGDIAELGKFSEACHKAVGEASIPSVDIMICLGVGCKPIVESWQEAHKPVVWCHDLDEVIKALQSQMQTGDIVLLKGSNKHCLWKVLSAF